jgi:hypothetical protein
MKRYLIRDKKTGQYLRKPPRSCGSWVDNADSATLYSSLSAVTCNINTFIDRAHVRGTPRKIQYSKRLGAARPEMFDFECIAVGVLIYNIDKQPFIDGILK